jgi:two-component system, chemotaxis family, protein-glutamate methylesterase/glutaminase
MEGAQARARRNPPGPKKSARKPIRVMIVDDSITARTVHSRIVEGDPAMSVVAIAGTAEQAIALLGAVQVDVILLDLEMPGIGGLDALPKILEISRGGRVLVVSSQTQSGAEHTLSALSLGAADTMPKPSSGGFGNDYRGSLLEKVRALGSASPTHQPPLKAVPPGRRAAGSTSKPKVLAIGASTGGIHALGLLFGSLSRRLDLPILVTQHLPGSFMPVFARQLTVASGYEASIADDDAEMLPGRILIAPGDAHLTVRMRGGRVRVRLDGAAQASGCTPSVDPMFSSVAEVFGSNTLGVVLSGMGRDGVEGARRIVDAGGTVLAQNEASCAVWGMPRAVADAGLAAAVLPPEEIAGRIAGSVGAAAWK